jgi:tetratricopeptide (TPR) repeat protein
MPTMACLDDNTLAAFLGGTLSTADRAEVERHVETCPTCRALVAELLKQERSTSGEPNDTLPSSQPRPSAPKPGRAIGRYVLQELIGQGGMGAVYSAYDPVLERKVALKLVRGERHLGGLSEVKERLLREGKSIAQLSHPNIVAVFDMGTSEGEVYVAMELVEGGSLRQWLTSAPRHWREVLERFIAAGQGLAAAHRAGLVHRDFKPENVLVGVDGRVRVTDFGLAASVPVPSPRPGPAPADPRLTQDGGVVGTPAYMAPEQYDGREATALSDQFSFCVALWEALLGARPYAPRVEDGTLQRVGGQAESAPVPVWLLRAVDRGLSLDPKQRYPSMEAVLEALAKDPARGRARRLRLAAAAAVPLLIAGAASWWVTTRADRLCKGAHAQVETLWNLEVADGIGRAFAGTGADDAVESWALARARIGTWFEQWEAMHTDACLATRVRGEQSDELLTRRMACLSRRRAEAQALLELFKKPDKEVVQRAPQAVDALVPLPTCADTEALLAEVGPPQTAAALKQVEAAQALLDEAKARFDTGLYEQAMARANEAVSLARASDYKPTLAEALVLLGRLLEHAGDLKASEKTLLEAITAAEAGKQDSATAAAATHLMLVLGVRQARYNEAHAWEQLAEGAVRRIGGSPPLEARLLKTKGLVRYAEGQLQDAIDAHQAAVALYEKVAPGSLELADALSSLGAAFRGARRAQDALKTFNRALEILLKAVGPNSDLVAATRNGVASSYMLEGRFDEALAIYRQAHDVFAKRLGPTHFRTVQELNNIGVVLAEQSKFSDALPYFQQVLDARKAASATDAKTADAYANVGMLLVELKRYDDAADMFAKAKGVLQGYPLDHFSQAEPLLGDAKLLLAKKAPDKAVEPLERVLKLCEGRAGFRFEYTQARAEFLMGRALSEGTSKQDGFARVRKAREAFAGFGPERFKRDLAEVDAWIASHEIRSP